MAHYKGAANEATRAMHIMRKREKAREELDLKRKKIEDDISLKTIDSKFAVHQDAIEDQLRSSTVGLVTLNQMRERHVKAVEEREKQLAREDDDKFRSAIKNKELQSTSGSTKNKKLSFGYDDEEDSDSEVDDEPKKQNKDEDKPEDSDVVPTSSTKKAKLLASIDVDTSFLPDREREEQERKLRESLAKEWRDRQQKLKEETIEITFSYWDGSGHRRIVQMKKGNSIYQFLQTCLENLRKDFNELRSVSADQLMYVKEDLIIPHQHTFYDFIVTKARGKSGPLFSFDVHDDIRLFSDISVEKDESHAGKVLLRSWYERNKHIFPASRWEPYDATKTYDRYTISDKRSK